MARKLRRDVGSIMNTNVVTVCPDTTVDRIAALLRTRCVTYVVVLDGGKPAGVVSERDLVNKVVAGGLPPGEVKAGEVMTSPAYLIQPDVDLGQAYEEMEERWSRRLVVADETGRLVGVITQSDLIAGLYEELRGALFENETLHEQALTQEKLAEQARIARRVQSQLIPDDAPDLGALVVAGSNTQAYEVGGDFFDYIPIGDDTVGIVVADVVGKGIPAAMLMVMARTVLRAQAIVSDSPAEVLQKANQTLVAERMPGQFVTLCYCVAKRNERTITVASAGHPPMMVYRQATGEVEHVDCNGLPLGVMPDGRYTEQRVSLCPGDTALLYTDGMVEVRSPEGEFFGLDALGAAFQECANEEPDAALERLATAVTNFGGDSHAFDDRTAVVIRAR